MGVGELTGWIRLVVDVATLLVTAALVFAKIDKRMSLLEQKIDDEFYKMHNNGFASKMDVVKLEGRIDAVKNICAMRHEGENHGA